ncbi:DCP2 [Ecytonucleospora hepatopenaei]|uniref:DCP2 n=1 Tax=Ecytonucleospora hepatopenaei TaxID=646526 RepID=A0A1W0E3U5_9MICR|nr:DCP2 [Ecytonucleospora hepatopenaei]
MNKKSETDKILRVLEILSKKYIEGNLNFLLCGKDYLFVLEEAYWCACDEYGMEYIPFKLFSMFLMKYCGYFDKFDKNKKEIIFEIRNILEKEDITNTNIFKTIFIDINSVLSKFHKEYDSFKKFKQNILVYGTCIFSEDGKKILVIKQKKKSNMALPKGKKNLNESGKECAIRETLEEIGYDVSSKITNFQFTVFDKLTFYLVFNVPESIKFEPKCKNEIQKIFWIEINKIPQNDTFKIVNTAINELKTFLTCYEATKFKFKINKNKDKKEFFDEDAFIKSSKKKNELFVNKIGKYLKKDVPCEVRTVEELTSYFELKNNHK